MATSQKTIDYLLEQLQSLPVWARRMFGEYALYYDNKVVALVCDDTLYVKPTEQGRAYLETVEEQPPYPGAKLYYLIEMDRWEEKEWLQELIIITSQSLPLPKQKKSKHLTDTYGKYLK